MTWFLVDLWFQHRALLWSLLLGERVCVMLCRHFGHQGPFWGRQYLFWHCQRPLTLIHEVFSPSLQRHLGQPPLL